MKQRSLLAALGVFVVAVVLTALAVLVAPLRFSGSSAVPGAPADPPSSPTIASASSASASASATPSASPTPSATPSPTPAPVAAAIVPVTNFRATPTSTNLAEVKAVLAGTSGSYEALELVASEADAILAELGLTRPSVASRLILASDSTKLAADLAKARTRLAFLRADAVEPSVRALAWGSDALFGVDRVTVPTDWPLVVGFAPGTPPDAFDPSATWTLFAGGDVLLDRGVYKTLVVEHKGADFPFDGGTAEITSRYCCSSFGWELPRTKRTGNAGAVRDLIEGADLAIANFENPAPNRVRWHTKGTVFSADPALIEGLATAGIDYVSLANNTSAMPARRGSSRRSRTSPSAESRSRARARTWPRPARRPCSKRAG